MAALVALKRLVDRGRFIEVGEEFEPASEGDAERLVDNGSAEPAKGSKSRT